MKKVKIADYLKQNDYPGRGIICGRSQRDNKAVAAYFIMGRSENSRNRIFVEDNGMVKTKAFIPEKLSDPSLVIYTAVRILGSKTIISNGDHTDTICEGMDKQMTFEQSLRCREFEPDEPNFTPRISAAIHINDYSKCGFNYALSIIKSDRESSDAVLRYNFAYNNPPPGKGHFIHTYKHNGDPLPSFEGEPQPVDIEGGIHEFAEEIWESLNSENKISLFVRFIDTKTGEFENKIINKNNHSM